MRGAFALCALLPAACQQEMAGQPSYRPMQPSSFFPDERSSRPLVPGTVARGHLRTDQPFFTGKRPGGASKEWAQAAAVLGTAPNGWAALGAAALDMDNAITSFPFPITAEVMERGRQRYTIYCAVCHDPLGTGRGKIVERGYTPPPSYHIERLRNASVGHFFEVITNGYGSMPDYRDQVPPRDRWSIIAYIRALQLSQHAQLADLPEEDRRHFEQGGAP